MASDEFPAPRKWRTWSDISEAFDGPDDLDWIVDQDRVEHDVRDPDSDHRSGA